MRKKIIKTECISCGKADLSKDEIGINKKLIGGGCDQLLLFGLPRGLS